MSAEQDQQTARRARAREVGLFRYGLIQDALDPALSTKQRGRVVRAVAAQIHPGPFGPEPVRVSRASLDRWIRAYRAGGFAALVPTPRHLAAQTPPEVLELAVGLKRETPGRTAAQVAVVLAAHAGWSPSARTLQRHFAALGLNRPRPDGTPAAVFGRFEAERPNARWVGDALHGPHIGGRKAILIAFLDDHCAPRGASLYPRRSRDELGGRFVGPMAYLDPKGEGDNSMPGKQRLCSGV